VALFLIQRSKVALGPFPPVQWDGHAVRWGGKRPPVRGIPSRSGVFTRPVGTWLGRNSEALVDHCRDVDARFVRVGCEFLVAEGRRPRLTVGQATHRVARGISSTWRTARCSLAPRRDRARRHSSGTRSGSEGYDAVRSVPNVTSRSSCGTLMSRRDASWRSASRSDGANRTATSSVSWRVSDFCRVTFPSLDDHDARCAFAMSLVYDIHAAI
jgi:hypothetical protein